MQCIKLGDVATFQNGFAFKSGEFVANGKYKIIKIKELKDGQVEFFDNSASVNIDINDNNKKYIVNNGDVLFALTGDPVSRNNPLSWVGRVSLYCHDSISFINQRVCKLIPTEKINPLYIYYYFRIFDNFYSLAEKATGSANQVNISTKTIENESIYLPEIELQNKIVSVLSAFDAKIQLNNKINRNLEEQTVAVFDSMFSNIRNGTYTIGNYIKLKRGKNLLSKNAIKGSVPVVAGGVKPAAYHNKANTTAPVITVSASGAAGFVNLWYIPVWSSDSSFIDSTITDNIYFWYVMLKKRQLEIYDLRTGSVQPHIYPHNIENMPVPYLESKKINDYTLYVKPLFNMIAKNKSENQHLSAMRDALLLELFSGKIDLSEVT